MRFSYTKVEQATHLRMREALLALAAPKLDEAILGKKTEVMGCANIRGGINIDWLKEWPILMFSVDLHSCIHDF